MSNPDSNRLVILLLIVIVILILRILAIVLLVYVVHESRYKQTSYNNIITLGGLKEDKYSSRN